jgi:quinol monooxygenase YgiN
MLRPCTATPAFRRLGSLRSLPVGKLSRASPGRHRARRSVTTQARTALLLCGLLGLGCKNDTNDEVDAAESQRRSALYACEETELIASPLVGPGFDRSKGGIVGEPQSSYVIFASQAYPKAAQRELFSGFVRAISAQLDSTPGALAYALATDAGCGVGRTLSVWTNEAALFQYAVSGAHAEAMSRGSEYFDSFKTTHWSASADELLSLDWERAKQVLDAVPPIWYD